MHEFPLGIQGSGTRIDFVLTNRTGSIYLICECKKVNPAFNWCFAKSSFRPNTYPISPLVLEALVYNSGTIVSQLYTLLHQIETYQVGVVVAGNEEGEVNDGSGDQRDQIEKVATQVFRGLNGFIHFCAVRQIVDHVKYKVLFVPVIFTTAKLWTSKTDLSTANVIDRSLSPEISSQVCMSPWVWLEYHQSLAFRHNIPLQESSKDLREILYREFVRPVAIVTPEGVENFLTSTLWEGFR